MYDTKEKIDYQSVFSANAILLQRHQQKQNHNILQQSITIRMQAY